MLRESPVAQGELPYREDDEKRGNRSKGDGMVVSDWSSTSSTAPAVKGVARTLAQHHQAVVGFLFGFFLVLVLYTTVSVQFGSASTIVVLQSAPAANTDQNARTSPPASAPNNYTQDAVQHDEGNNLERNSGQMDDVTKKIVGERIQDNIHGTDMNHIKQSPPRKPICDLSDPRYDFCEISGDARAIGTNRSVIYVPPAGGRGADSQEWSIRDQSRKYLEYINKVTVKSLNASQSQLAPECTSRHAVPAIVFAMNGLTSNPWHDFSDVLIPLFITTRAFDGEVQFLVSDLQPWFVDKYQLILKNLSRFDIVDFNKDGGVRCYPHIVVGLRSHRDLGIDPARAPRNYTMLDFRMYIRDIYSLPPADVDIPYKEANSAAGAGATEQRKARLMLINRGRNRKFVNVPEITAAVQAAGFEVLLVEPRRDLSVQEFSRVVDSCDVLMGAHGAGLVNFFFLRTNAVLLQVVPWGHMEHPSMVFYGRPAKEMRLRDVEYSITAEESTLYEKYGKDHPAVSDPESIHKQGWQLGMKYYWLEQDIRLNVTRFAPTLQRVLRALGE